MKTLLTLPALFFLLLPAVMGWLGDKPWKQLLLNSGYCTVGLLCLSLILSPVSKHFPKVQLFKKIKRYRREIGLSVFFYACFHFFSYVMRSFEKRGMFEFKYFFHPVIAPGVIAFIILLILALTSNDRSIQAMGYKKWKHLHRYVYGAEALVFLHIFLQSKTLALSIFIPLLFIQLWRLPRQRHHKRINS